MAKRKHNNINFERIIDKAVKQASRKVQSQQYIKSLSHIQSIISKIAEDILLDMVVKVMNEYGKYIFSGLPPSIKGISPEKIIKAGIEPNLEILSKFSASSKTEQKLLDKLLCSREG